MFAAFYRPSRLKGFSLIESAIVLGIIGLVIGGIWTAASVVQNKQRIQNAVQLLTIALEEGANYKKTTTAVANLNTILVLRPLPGDYRTNTIFLKSGTHWIYFYLQPNSGSPYVQVYTLLNASGWVSGYSTKPDLCLELSKKALSIPLTTPSASHAITWKSGDSAFALTAIATWDFGSAPPSPSTLATTCASATVMAFNPTL